MTIHSDTPPTDNDDDNAMQLASVPARENFPLHHCYHLLFSGLISMHKGVFRVPLSI